MMVSNHLNYYTNAAPAVSAGTTSAFVKTESDGSTVMQYTTLSPNGAITRKNVLLSRPEDNEFARELTPTHVQRKRTDAFDNMMAVL